MDPELAGDSYTTLFDEALDQALSASDIAQALSDLEAMTRRPHRDEVVARVLDNRESILEAARPELRSLDASDAVRARAISDAVSALISDPDVAADLTAARERVADAEQRLLQAQSEPSENGAAEAEVRRVVSVARAALVEFDESIRQRVQQESSRWPEVEAAVIRWQNAWERAKRSLAERGMVDVIRPWLTSQLEEQRKLRYSTRLTIDEAPGLRELTNPAHQIPTEASAVLSRLLAQMSGGSVGISGPRGVGKTSLIKASCSPGARIGDSTPSIALWLPAPVQYSPLDFILHLFAKACASLLPADALREQTNELLQTQPWLQRVAPAIAAIAVVVGVSLAAVSLTRFASAVVDGAASDIVRLQRMLIGAAGVAAALTAAMLVRRRRGASLAEFVERLRGMHPEELRDRLLSQLLGPTDDRRQIRLLALAAVAVPIGLVATLAVFGLPPDGISAGIILSLGLIESIPLALALASRYVNSWRRSVGEALASRLVEAGSVAPRFSVMERLSTAALATGVALLVVSTVLVAGTPFGVSPSYDTAIAVIGFVLGSLVARETVGIHSVFVSVRAAVEESEARDRTSRGYDPLRRQALESLRAIRFQQSVSAGQSTKAGLDGLPGLPVSFEASQQSSSSLELRAWTLPEATDELSLFLSEAAARGPVVIGIDELDKMNAVDAERFINSIKGLISIPNCYFLVSVSEDAMSSFERRGLPFRDVFDSSFDEILQIRYLNLRETEDLLAPKLIGLPLPYAAWCFCLSGGLPRDTFREARALIDLRRLTRLESLGELAAVLIRRNMSAKRDATAVAIRRQEGPLPRLALEWVAGLDVDDMNEQDLTRWTAVAVAAQAASGGPAQDGTAETLRLIDEFATYWYFCATLSALFVDQRDFSMLEPAVSGTPDGPIARLAKARQTLAFSPGVAWERLTDVRRELGLSKVVRPTAHQPPGPDTKTRAKAPTKTPPSRTRRSSSTTAKRVG